MEVAIKDIKVGNRFRKTFEGIVELAASISTVGQIEPIIIDENNNLIAGERRLKAFVLLKRETIEVKIIEKLDDYQKKEIELEENIQRHAFTWQEEVAAKAELHKLKEKIYGTATRGHEKPSSWNISDTAKLLGESPGTISMDLQLARGMGGFPEFFKEKSKTVAFKKMKQLQERALNEELARRMGQTTAITHPEIINGNCLDEMQKMESNSVDLILTDPPYGIDIDNAQTYKRLTMSDTNFIDSDFETYDLLDKTFNEFY